MRLFTYLILFILMSACASTSQPGDKNMRRFTFAAFNQLFDTTAFKTISANSNLKQTLEEAGLINFNYCTSDSISYLVLDMEETFNLEKTKELFFELGEKQEQLGILSEVVSGTYTLLNRIYKFEQQHAYTAEQGQLIPLQKDNYARFVLTLEIINDSLLAKDYISVHGIGKAWPEITQNMKTVGIHEMELYLSGYRAFLIMDTKPDFDWGIDGEKWGTLPREKEWQTYVAKFQKTNPESKAAEKWKAMQVISF